MKWCAAMWMVAFFAVLSAQCHAEAAGPGPAKSCQEIARLIVSTEATRNTKVPPLSPESLHCAGAHGIAGGAALQLAKTSWNQALQRWEFTLRCTRPKDCVPFLVWAAKEKTAAKGVDELSSAMALPVSLPKYLPKNQDAKSAEVMSAALVKPGQTVTLSWEERGIRVVLPVTCLDAGGMGQLVRARLKNAPRILRAEVVGKAMLRAVL